MRGLTGLEVRLLEEQLDLSVVVDATPGEALIFEALERRGLVRGESADERGFAVVWHLTSLGHLALRIHRAITTGVV